MNSHERHLELKVGIFVLVGLLVIGAMVVHFGRFSEGLRRYYRITVEFRNASGLLKDSDVLFGGAKIGRVADKPRLTDQPRVIEANNAVEIVLDIYEGARIPSGSIIMVGSSGLLGDRYVDVIPPADFDGASYLKAGDIVAGSRKPSLDDLQQEGYIVMEDLQKLLTKIRDIVDRLNEGFLSQVDVDELNDTISNLQATSKNLKESSSKIDGVISDARGALKTADSAMESATNAADKVAGAASEAKQFISEAETVLKKGLEGEGLLPALLKDRELTENLTALISNMRRHGILFYRDSDTGQEPLRAEAGREKPKPAKIRPRRPRR